MIKKLLFYFSGCLLHHCSIFFNSVIATLERIRPFVPKDSAILAVRESLDSPHKTSSDIEGTHDNDEGRSCLPRHRVVIKCQQLQQTCLQYSSSSPSSASIESIPTSS